MIEVTLKQYRNWCNFVIARIICPETQHDHVVTEIIKLYKTNISIKDISNKTNTDRRTIQKIITRYNIYMEEIIDEILQYENTNTTVKKIYNTGRSRLIGKGTTNSKLRK